MRHIKKYYGIMVGLWKNADEDVPMLMDARQRLNALGE